MHAEPEYYRLKISGIREEVNDVKIISFQQDPNYPVTYEAGQYLTFIFRHLGNEIRRSYSITSIPGTGEPLSIGVKRIPNGIFSRFLTETARPGTELLCSGAGGFFTLPENLKDFEQLFFFAAGNGITPVYALIKFLALNFSEKQVVLVYSNRSEKETLFKNELEAFAAESKGTIQIRFIFSNSPDLRTAHLYRELLIELVKEYAQFEPAKLLAYTCGPKEYMRMCTYGLHAAGFTDAAIRKEQFVFDSMAVKPAPPDKAKHTVSLIGKSRTIHFECQYPDSILKAARKKGFVISYSCESGQCGNCVAQCLEGEVWMTNNEVLTEKDLAKGLVLTCVGYPVNGDVVLKV